MWGFFSDFYSLYTDECRMNTSEGVVIVFSSVELNRRLFLIVLIIQIILIVLVILVFRDLLIFILLLLLPGSLQILRRIIERHFKGLFFRIRASGAFPGNQSELRQIRRRCLPSQGPLCHRQNPLKPRRHMHLPGCYRGHAPRLKLLLP